MAEAPEPGAANEPEPSRALRITMHGKTIELNMAELGPGDDLVSRQQAGLPVRQFLDGSNGAFATDAFLVVWWMARRKNGEPNLSFASVLEDYPTYAALSAAEPAVEAVEVPGKA